MPVIVWSWRVRSSLSLTTKHGIFGSTCVEKPGETGEVWKCNWLQIFGDFLGYQILSKRVAYAFLARSFSWWWRIRGTWHFIRTRFGDPWWSKMKFQSLGRVHPVSCKPWAESNKFAKHFRIYSRFMNSLSPPKTNIEPSKHHFEEENHLNHTSILGFFGRSFSGTKHSSSPGWSTPTWYGSVLALVWLWETCLGFQIFVDRKFVGGLNYGWVEESQQQWGISRKLWKWGLVSNLEVD